MPLSPENTGRITQPPFESLNDAQKEIYTATVANLGKPIGPRMVLLHHNELAQSWSEFANVLKKASYPASVRELAILLVARHWDADFEWYAHVGNAVSAGVPLSVIDAIRMNRAPVIEDVLLAIVYTYVTSLLAKHKVSEADYRATREALGERDMITLTALVGHYCNVALTLLAHEVPLPEGVVPPFIAGSASKDPIR